MTGFDGNDKWKSEFDICATLFFGLIKNHPFHDVNKRTAFLTLLYHLRKIKRTPITKQKEFELLALRIASNELDKYQDYSRYNDIQDGQILYISDFLRKNSRVINKNEYIITYHDLDTILRHYGFGLENPMKNNIDLVHYDKQQIGFFKKREQINSRRIGVISFPGWKKQVNTNDLKLVRRITKLTTEDGVDSEAFFHDAEPFFVLIAQYQGPLQRLADK